VGGVGGGALNDNGDRREYKIILILLITILIKNINSTPPSSFPKSNKINMADKDYRPSSSVGSLYSCPIACSLSLSLPNG
jgi:hypothetical protein